MSAAATASNLAQLHALERILDEVTKIRTLVVASLVFAAIAALVGVVALVRGESLETRVRHLEEFVIRKDQP